MLKSGFVLGTVGLRGRHVAREVEMEKARKEIQRSREKTEIDRHTRTAGRDGWKLERKSHRLKDRQDRKMSNRA